MSYKTTGIGCSSCSGGCGANNPMIGMGYFTSLDPSTWGVAEWGTVAVVGYVGFNALSSHPALKRGRKRVGSAASKGASSLGNIALLGAAGYAAWWLYSQYQAGTLSIPGLSTPAAGVGDYQPQGYVNPQILMSPGSSSQVRVPLGWAA